MNNTEIDKNKLPKHIAIIMDGNGRWAKSKGKIRIQGHEEGVKRVKEIIQAAAVNQIEYLTLYTFSSENWNRPKMEVEALMMMLLKGLKRELKQMHENGIKFSVIGDLERFPEALVKEIEKAEELTKDNKGLTVSLALGYGGQGEIVEAVKKIAKKVKEQQLEIEQINKEIFEQNLYTKGMPEVDLLIRTSGETRISNFLLWQIAYAELYFTGVYWPDFTKEEFEKALLNYQSRERRFGKTSEQLS